MVLFLLENKIDFTIKNISGKVASEDAYDRGYYEISEVILDKEMAKDKNKNKEQEVNEDDEINFEDFKELKDLQDDNEEM